MFEWPSFAAYLDGVRHPREGIVALLADLAEPGAPIGSREVLSALFEDGALVNEVEALAPRFDHVGLVAPAGLGLCTVREILDASAFRRHIRAFRSTVLASELTLSLGRPVDVMVVQASADAPAARWPMIEIFVADLPAVQIEELVANEFGCHVALELAPNASLGRIREVLHLRGQLESSSMHGPVSNDEIRSSVLFFDVPGRELARRLEFIAPETAEN